MPGGYTPGPREQPSSEPGHDGAWRQTLICGHANTEFAQRSLTKIELISDVCIVLENSSKLSQGLPREVVGTPRGGGEKASSRTRPSTWLAVRSRPRMR